MTTTITIAGRAVRVLHLALAAAAAVIITTLTVTLALAGSHGATAVGGDSPGLAACITSRIANGNQAVEYGNMPGSLTVAQGEARQFCNMGRAFSAASTPDGAGPDATGYNGG
jgi:hypothetical protein